MNIRSKAVVFLNLVLLTSSIPFDRPPKNSQSCVEVLFVEARPMYSLQRVLENAFEWGQADLVTLVHGDTNADYVTRVLQKVDVLANHEKTRKDLRYVNMHFEDLGADRRNQSDATWRQKSAAAWHNAYSRILKSAELWNQVRCENVVVSQADALFCKRSPLLKQFMGFDFIGGYTPEPNLNAWLEIWTKQHNLPVRNHLNGGFSYRHKSKMLACVAPNSGAADANIHPIVGLEDSYFMSCPCLNVAPVDIANKFAEDGGHLDTNWNLVGAHKPWLGAFGIKIMKDCNSDFKYVRAEHMECGRTLNGGFDCPLNYRD